MSLFKKLVNKVRKQIQKSLPEFNGGFSTGYGAFILKIGYQAIKGDWSDVSSEHHY